MQTARVTLPPDVSYFIDNSLNNNELNAFTHCTLNLYGDRKVVVEIVDSYETLSEQAIAHRATEVRAGCRILGSGLSVRGRVCLQLDQYAHQLASDLPNETRRSLFAATLVREPAVMVAYAEVLAGWNYEDSTEGGCLEPFRRGRDLRLRKDRTPTPKTERKLFAPAAIRRYVKYVDSTDLNYCDLATANLRRLPWPDSLLEAGALEQYFIEMRERQREYENEQVERMLGRLPDFVSRSVKKPAKQYLRDRRKRMSRSASTAATIIGREKVSKFIRGEKVEVRGENLCFAVSGDPGDIGHGSLKIDLMEKDTRLSSLCLFFDKTPAIEQLASLQLYVDAGGETELLETGNLYNVTPDGAQSPIIRKRLSRYPNNNGIQVRDSHIERQQRIRAYIEQTQHLYLRALVTRMWGTDTKRLVVLHEHSG